MLFGKSLTASIVFSRAAITVPAPVFERPQDAEKGLVGCYNRPAFAKRYVVCRVEGMRSQMAERTGVTEVGWVSS